MHCESMQTLHRKIPARIQTGNFLVVKKQLERPQQHAIPKQRKDISVFWIKKSLQELLFLTCKYEEYGFFHYGGFHTWGVHNTCPFLHHPYTISVQEWGTLKTKIKEFLLRTYVYIVIVLSNFMCL